MTRFFPARRSASISGDPKRLCGIRVPAGEIYFAGEGANGELGFYIVSDGSGRPYRIRVRPPCWYGMAALEDMVRGHMISDLAAIFGLVYMIGGECDR